MYTEAKPMETDKYSDKRELLKAENILKEMPHELSSALKFLMRYYKISCTELSDKTSISARTIQKIRTGKEMRPDICTLIKISNAIGAHPFIGLKLIELSGQCFTGSSSSLSLFEALVYHSLM